MADVTAAPVPVGSSEFNPPLHFQQLAAHFGAPGMFAVANAAALPSTGNWQGRMLLTTNDGAVYKWWSGAWRLLSYEVEWTALTAASGWTAGTGANGPQVMRSGTDVYYRGSLFGGPANTTATVLPVWARPSRTTRLWVAHSDGTAGSVRIFAAGTMQPSGAIHPETSTSWSVA